MSDNLKEKIKCTIPIKVNSYEELFREFDYRDVKDRSINVDLQYLYNVFLLCYLIPKYFHQILMYLHRSP